jgi:aminomethyltransferase
MSATWKRTPLYERHVALGAKIVDFAGWAMPVTYDGLIAEHQRVRSQAGLFDVSHMGELHFQGPTAGATLDQLATNDVAALPDGKVLYTALCNEDGGVRDDALIYRLTATRYLMVVNASNTGKIAAWSRDHLLPGTVMQDLSERTALLALQGPASAAILSQSQSIGPMSAILPALDYYEFAYFAGPDVPTVVSRTGYTGERGYEIYLAPERAGDLWDELLALGKSHGLGPAGLGARDTLRFEVGFCLYGNELEETISPLEAGIGWTVKLRKPHFIGKQALERQKANGVSRTLLGFEIQDRAIARHGFEVSSQGREVGRVTSGTWSPSLERSLGLALVERSAARQPLTVRIRGRELPLHPVPIPFRKPVSRA